MKPPENEGTVTYVKLTRKGPWIRVKNLIPGAGVQAMVNQRNHWFGWDKIHSVKHDV